MSKTKLKVRVNIGSDEEVKAIPDEVKGKIPRPGDSIFIIEPYPVVNPEDVDDEEILEEDVKGKQIMGYSYAGIMVKGSVLSDDMESVLVNGDYKIDLYKTSNSDGKKLRVFGNEEEALDQYNTLMNISLKEVDRRITLNQNIKANLKESLEKLYH